MGHAPPPACRAFGLLQRGPAPGGGWLQTPKWGGGVRLKTHTAPPPKKKEGRGTPECELSVAFWCSLQNNTPKNMNKNKTSWYRTSNTSVRCGQLNSTTNGRTCQGIFVLGGTRGKPRGNTRIALDPRILFQAHFSRRLVSCRFLLKMPTPHKGRIDSAYLSFGADGSNLADRGQPPARSQTRAQDSA